MSDQESKENPIRFPQYRAPQGIPIADTKQSSLLMKAARSLRPQAKRHSVRTGSRKSGHISPSTIKIGHKKKPRFY